MDNKEFLQTTIELARKSASLAQTNAGVSFALVEAVAVTYGRNHRITVLTQRKAELEQAGDKHERSRQAGAVLFGTGQKPATKNNAFGTSFGSDKPWRN